MGKKRKSKKPPKLSAKAAKKQANKVLKDAIATLKPTIYRRLSDQECLVFEKHEAKMEAASALAQTAEVRMEAARDATGAFMATLAIRDRKKKPVEKFSIGRVDGVLCALAASE